MRARKVTESSLAFEIGTRARVLWTLVGLLLVASVGFVDSATGYEYEFGLFYLAPIALVTWFSGRRLGIVVSLASAVASFVADYSTGHLYGPPVAYYWNVGMSFGFFLVVTLLLSALKDSLRRVTALANTDPLTGAINTRFFFGLMEIEMARSRRTREPLTLAYIDVDDFKSVNDKLGHSAGDRVLRGVVEAIKDHLRESDVVARMGGDEFAVLLPDTGYDAAAIAIPKMQRGLNEVMRANDWPVTISIGAFTCADPLPTVDSLLGAADELMYAVKKSGKNGFRHSRYEG